MAKLLTDFCWFLRLCLMLSGWWSIAREMFILRHFEMGEQPRFEVLPMCSCAASNLQGKHSFITSHALSRLDYFVCVCVCVCILFWFVLYFSHSLSCSKLRWTFQSSRKSWGQNSSINILLQILFEYLILLNILLQMHLFSSFSTFFLWDSTGKWMVFDAGQTMLF